MSIWDPKPPRVGGHHFFWWMWEVALGGGVLIMAILPGMVFGKRLFWGNKESFGQFVGATIFCVGFQQHNKIYSCTVS